MKSLIDSLLKNHEEELNKATKEFQSVSEKCIEENIRIATNSDGSTSMDDCRFLQLLCIEKKPQKILEIGTWIGTTIYAMAFATNNIKTSLFTCDRQDAFLQIECKESERIHTNPNTLSSDLLENEGLLRGIDYIFNDARVTYEDCKRIYNLAMDNFSFITHDYYDSNGNHEKGYDAIKALVKVLEENNAQYKLYAPKREWYSSGYKNNINACCAYLECKKTG